MANPEDPSAAVNSWREKENTPIPIPLSLAYSLWDLCCSRAWGEEAKYLMNAINNVFPGYFMLEQDEILDVFKEIRTEKARIWKPIDAAPKNDFIDILAKNWLPATDGFVFRRFPDCRFNPGDTMTGRKPYWGGVDDNWRPVAWMPRPPEHLNV